MHQCVVPGVAITSWFFSIFLCNQCFHEENLPFLLSVKVTCTPNQTNVVFGPGIWFGEQCFSSQVPLHFLLETCVGWNTVFMVWFWLKFASSITRFLMKDHTFLGHQFSSCIFPIEFCHIFALKLSCMQVIMIHTDTMSSDFHIQSNEAMRKIYWKGNFAPLD